MLPEHWDTEEEVIMDDSLNKWLFIINGQKTICVVHENSCSNHSAIGKGEESRGHTSGSKSFSASIAS